MTFDLRSRLGNGIFARVAGPEGPANRDRIHLTPGRRWFGQEAVIRRVHGDASMFVGGLRALLLQSLHPLAMAAVEDHSGYKSDPWGRLARTSYFLAVTTFGEEHDAQQAVDLVKAVHLRVTGVAPDGRAYAASDPHLLKWVHIAEVDSFLLAHQLYGKQPLTSAQCDEYVAQTARVAGTLGVIDPPMTKSELDIQLSEYRSELKGTAEAKAAARFILFRPPVPVVAYPLYAPIGMSAVSLLPAYARRELRLPYVPGIGSAFGTAAGRAVTGVIRWALPPAPVAATNP